jgi:25S rRNA (uracil2634-N3)-methyltransferase
MRSSIKMLTENGEIHITHKTAYPFNRWEIVELGKENGLFLLEEMEFYRWCYPGYINRRGSGTRIDDTFPVGECSTFKFTKYYPGYI